MFGEQTSSAEEELFILARDEKEWNDWQRALSQAINWRSNLKRSYLAKGQARSRRRMSDVGVGGAAAQTPE